MGLVIKIVKGDISSRKGQNIMLHNHRMKSIFFSITILLICLLLPSNDSFGFSGLGFGTLENPYQITSCAQLQEISLGTNAHYELSNDIDCSDTINWNNGEGFVPIGDAFGMASYGSLNGNNHVVDGLYINREDYFVILTDEEFGEWESQLAVGLFSTVVGSYTIKNISLINVDVTGSFITGALVGRAYHSTILNTLVSGTVSGGTPNGVESSAGGLVGYAAELHVEKSISMCDVSGVSNVGGLIGRMLDSFASVIDSYATGNVSGLNNVGGLVGEFFYSTITNSYATGNVSGENNVGGLVGKYLEKDNCVTTQIIDSFSTGEVLSSGTKGGFIGVCANNSYFEQSLIFEWLEQSLINVYYLNRLDAPLNCFENCPNFECAAILDNENYFKYSSNPPMTNWDFADIWTICEGTSLPYLKWQGNLCIEENNPPVLDPIGNNLGTEGELLGAEGELLEFIVTASDPDVDDTLTFGADNLPEGAVFDPETATFSWTPGYDQEGIYENVEFSVTDNGDLLEVDTELITITIGNINRPPIFYSVGPQLITEGETLDIFVNATDPDGDSVSLETSDLPDGALFDSSTRLFSWTPNYVQEGSYVITFIATDNGDPNESTEMGVPITVGNVSDPVTLTEVLINEILNNPDLEIGVGNPLIATLKKLIDHIEGNKIKSSINKLLTFICKAESYKLSGDVDYATADYYIALASDIITNLGGDPFSRDCN